MKNAHGQVANRLLETMPSRAIDLRPHLARAVDCLTALGAEDCADVFADVALRVETWRRDRFDGLPWHRPSSFL